MTQATDLGLAVPEWTLGDRLRKARENAGLQVQDFAARLGISRNTVSNYEADRTKPNRPTLLVWAAHCAVPVSWLETGSVDANPDGDGAPAIGLEPITCRFSVIRTRRSFLWTSPNEPLRTAA